ncbi:MAG: YciK family oxidoreductase [Marinobacterium sp.]|nr:YciK family oxidoreductase [Marinobacterium sp.]
MYDYQAPEQLLQGRVILVTGAGDGIGRAAAKAYAAAGATVVLLGRTLEKLEQVYDEIEAAGHPQPALVPLNLESASEHDYQELAATLENEFGRLDGLLNNASILGLRTPLDNYDPSTWQQVMQINVNGTFMLTQAMLPLLKEAEEASVIFTSSGVGRKGRAYWGAYAVSKFATEGMMQVLADEVDGISNVRVNCINPGATRTNMRTTAYPGEPPTNNPTADDIMPLYLYLMGPDSRNVQGQTLDAQ